MDKTKSLFLKVTQLKNYLLTKLIHFFRDS